MTALRNVATVASMAVRRWLLVLLLLVTSLGATATVHAREWGQAVTLECTGEVHSAGDRDESPGDSDNGLPHHHGNCQGSNVALSTADTATAVSASTEQLVASGSGWAVAAHADDPALRPPNA